MRRYRNIAILVLVVLAVILVLQNTSAVVTRILFWEVSAPRAVLLAVTLLIGFVVGLLTAWRHGTARKASAS